ncbi:MAG: hypothetical protein P8Y97_08570 [Candidatus Lokiarchaeota archaeon]
MGKGGVVLGIIGILLGAGGIGYGFFLWINQNNLQNSVGSQKIWHSSYNSIYTPPELEYVTIPNMSILIELNSPVSLHLLFTSSAKIINDSGFSDILFYFMLNDVRLTSPFTRVGTYQGVAEYNYYSVVLQKFYEKITPGMYNFTIQVISEYGANFLRESEFFIQSFPI